MTTNRSLSEHPKTRTMEVLFTAGGTAVKRRYLTGETILEAKSLRKTWVTLPCGLSSSGCIITAGKKRQLSEHCNLLYDFNCWQKNKGHWQVPSGCPHFFFYFLLHRNHMKEGVLLLLSFFFKVCEARWLVAPVWSLRPWTIDSPTVWRGAEWPATVITACSFLRFLLFGAEVTARTKKVCCREPKSCF